MASSYPINHDTNSYLNKPLWYKFDKNIDMTTVYTGSVVLFDSATQHLIEGAFSYDEASFTLTFLPAKTLSANTTYTWTLAGNDTEDAVPIKYADGTYLASSVFIDFQTGGVDKVYDNSPSSDSIYGNGSGSAIIEDGATLAERNADTFKVIHTVPEHKTALVDVATTSITITFSKDLDISQDLSTLINISYEPFLRTTYYFKTKEFNATTTRMPGEPVVADKWDMPAGTWTISGATATWTKTDPADCFNANAIIVIRLNGGIKDVDGTLFDTHDEKFYFTTQIFPMFTSVNAVVGAFHAIAGTLDEFDVLRFILKNSHRIETVTNWKIDVLRPTSAAISFVECQSVVELIDNLLIGKEINAGKTLRLADLSIDYGYPRSGVAQIALKQAAQQCAEKAWIEVLATNAGADGKSRVGFATGERGKHASLVWDKYRDQMHKSQNTLNIYPLQVPR